MIAQALLAIGLSVVGDSTAFLATEEIHEIAPIEVRVDGNSNMTTQWVLENADWGKDEPVVVMLGNNDFVRYDNINTHYNEDFMRSAMQDDIRAVLDFTDDRKVYWVTPYSKGMPEITYAFRGELLDSTAQVIDWVTYVENRPGEELLFPDGVHGTHAGQDAVAQLIWNQVQLGNLLARISNPATGYEVANRLGVVSE